LDLACANWRARWAYHLARNVRGNTQIPDDRKREVTATLNHLLELDENLYKQAGLPPSPRIPVSIALYRNRS
jgi:CRISPR-associated protein Csm1